MCGDEDYEIVGAFSIVLGSFFQSLHREHTLHTLAFMGANRQLIENPHGGKR